MQRSVRQASATERVLLVLLMMAGACADGDGTPAQDAAVERPDTGQPDAATAPGPGPDGQSPSRADAGASDDAGGPAQGPIPCEIEAPTACPDPQPTYGDDIEPIIEARCIPCHYGADNGPWPLTSYGHVADWYDTIRAAMLHCTMPPPESKIEMPDAERLLILEWLRCGYPR